MPFIEGNYKQVDAHFGIPLIHTVLTFFRRSTMKASTLIAIAVAFTLFDASYHLALAHWLTHADVRKSAKYLRGPAAARGPVGRSFA